MITVLSVLGTRPEAIKMAPVIAELGRHPGELRSVVCATAQHRAMLDQVLEVFGIVPDHDLNLMRTDQSLSELTGHLFLGLERVVQLVRPDWILAQGDTTTVLAAALSAYYQGVKFGHVEAGLRTGDLARPFPEEANRRVADLLAGLCFAPTERSRANLLREGVSQARVLVTGNTAVDALLAVKDLPFDWSAGPLAALPRDRQLVLVTAHRRESFGGPLREICLALRDLAAEFAGRAHFVYPVHPNPGVRQSARELLAGRENISLLEPLDYPAMVQLLKASTLILTDSGGIQEEAPSLGVPVLVMRGETERPEGVEAGVLRLVGTGRAGIVEGARRLLGDPAERQRMATGRNPYGDGQAARRIVAGLLGKPEEWNP